MVAFEVRGDPPPPSSGGGSFSLLRDYLLELSDEGTFDDSLNHIGLLGHKEQFHLLKDPSIRVNHQLLKAAHGHYGGTQEENRVALLASFEQACRCRPPEGGRRSRERFT